MIIDDRPKDKFGYYATHDRPKKKFESDYKDFSFSKVERTGHPSRSKRIKALIKNGQDLADWRKEQFSLLDGEDILLARPVPVVSDMLDIKEAQDRANFATMASESLKKRAAEQMEKEEYERKIQEEVEKRLAANEVPTEEK